MRSLARYTFLAVVLLALPGYLWSSFEMYGLTLVFGSQMLFFSIVHTSPILVLLVMMGVAFCSVWWILSLVALIVEGYQSRIGAPRAHHIAFLVTIGSHLLMLMFYDEWASSLVRILVCLVGIAMVLLTLKNLRGWFFSRKSPCAPTPPPNTSLERTREG